MILGALEYYVVQRAHRCRCDLCGEPILVGQSCVRWTWKHDGDPPMSLRVHATCDVEARTTDWYYDEWPDA